jgi:hypothetical protein
VVFFAFFAVAHLALAAAAIAARRAALIPFLFGFSGGSMAA